MSEAGCRVLRFAGFQRAVSSVARSIDFYCNALGFTEAARSGRSAHLTLGDQAIDLVQNTVPAPPVLGIGFHHIAIVTKHMARAVERLNRFDAKPISCNGAQLLPGTSGGVTAYKFRDPDGHPLELISFPQNGRRGEHAQWTSSNSSALTLGIDHSAIVVEDAEASVDFYTRVLGFTVSGRQINAGPEQENLDGIDRATVEVIGLSPIENSTPHLELLAYQVPRFTKSNRHLLSEHLDLMTFVVEGDCNVAGSMIRDPDGYPLLLKESGPSIKR